MLGAVVGDVIGSVFEWHNVKSTDFPLYDRFTRYTDDTVLTAAVADAVLSREKHKNKLFDYFAGRKLYAEKLRQYAKWYPDVGYGQQFEAWSKTPGAKPYRSYGNGSAMRVSPIGFIPKKRSARSSRRNSSTIFGGGSTRSGPLICLKLKQVLIRFMDEFEIPV
ncbi:ADP-ribosylglycohydrolase family protein [Paenibacillus sp. S-38]|uniref:ADP-ribosylglycohydrolase family protein n=1 Tax=Paenibacillus sp. S-38 TaxID=3416710 RepID=UPI003CE67A00